MPNALTVDETNPETAVRQANPPLNQWVIYTCVSRSPCEYVQNGQQSAVRLTVSDSIVDEEFLANMTDLLSSKNKGPTVQKGCVGRLAVRGLILSHVPYNILQL